MNRRLSLAERTLQELGISKPEEIDVEVIAWHLGAKVKYRTLHSCEARIIGQGNRAIITVDDRKSPQRRRFSVAHELGHWRHHRGRCLICRAEEIGRFKSDSSNSSRSSVADPERVADDYAADLLLPGYIFDPIMRQHGKLNLKVVRDIAGMFDVSLTAAAIRILETNRYPAMLVSHGQDGRRWFKRPSCVPDRWFPTNELHRDSFAFELLFGNGTEDIYPKRIGADAWFDRPEAERYEVFEQSFTLPNREIVTLLIFSDPKMLEEWEASSRLR